MAAVLLRSKAHAVLSRTIIDRGLHGKVWWFCTQPMPGGCSAAGTEVTW